MDPAYTLRTLEDAEWQDYARLLWQVFHEVAHEDEMRRWHAVADPARHLAVDAPEGDLVGTAGAFSLAMSMGAADPVGCAAVTAVTVRPDHRRRGLLTAMMQRLLQDARDAGEPMAALFASEGRIYGRYGFGPGVPQQGLRTTPQALSTIEGDRSQVRVVDADSAKEHLPGIAAAHARQRGGMLQRTPAWYATWLDHRRESDDPYAARWHAVVPGRGYAVFRVRDGDWVDRRPGATLKVEELVATDPDATAALWSFLGSVDLVTTISAPARPADDPLPYLVAAESEVDPRPALPLWVRLLDLPAALTGRHYDVHDQLVLAVDDAQLPANTGRWSLEVGPGTARCERTDRPADVALSTSLLATLVLGGVAATRLADAGRLGDTAPSVVRRLDRLFATPRAPWQPFDF